MMNVERNGPDRMTITYALLLSVIVALYRAMPYYLFDPYRAFLWNLVPIGALGLFVGSRWRTRYDALVPVSSMLLADLLLIYPLAQMGYSSFSWFTPVLYLSFVGYVLLGRLIRPHELAPFTLLSVSLCGSAQFFLISNFCAWLRGAPYVDYPHTLAGLLESYVAALPFYRNTILGDLFFTAMIFPAHAVLRNFTVSEKVRQPGSEKVRQPI